MILYCDIPVSKIIAFKFNLYRYTAVGGGGEHVEHAGVDGRRAPGARSRRAADDSLEVWGGTTSRIQLTQ
jgi:hypothetical protein